VTLFDPQLSAQLRVNGGSRRADDTNLADEVRKAYLGFLASEGRPLRSWEGEALNVVDAFPQFLINFNVVRGEGQALKSLLDTDKCVDWLESALDRPVRTDRARVSDWYVVDQPPSPPPSTPPPTLPPPADLIRADLDSAGGSAGTYIILVLVLGICMLPLSYLLYARLRYREAWLLFLRWRTTHSKTSIPWRYMPREDREELRRKLDGLDDLDDLADTASVTFIPTKVSDANIFAAMYPSDEPVVVRTPMSPSVPSAETETPRAKIKYWV